MHNNRSGILFNHWLIAITDYDSKHFLMFNFLQTQHYLTFLDSSKMCKYQEVDMYLPVGTFLGRLGNHPRWFIEKQFGVRHRGLIYSYQMVEQQIRKSEQKVCSFPKLQSQDYLPSRVALKCACFMKNVDETRNILTRVVFHKITSCIY